MLPTVQRFSAESHLFVFIMMILALFYTGTVAAKSDEDWGDYSSKATGKIPQISGRLGFDAAGYKSDVTHMGAGTELSYARISVKGVVDSQWRYLLQYDFAGGGSIKNVWLGYDTENDYRIKIGNLLEPVSMDETTSSADISFIERALPNVFAPSYHIGGSIEASRPDYYFNVGVFGDTPNADPSNEGNESYGISGRATYAPVEEKNRVLHFGLSVAARTPDSTEELRFRARPESDLTDIRFVDTGKIHDVSHYTLTGLEAAAMVESTLFQAEYINTNVMRDNSSTLSFDGGYAQLSWLLSAAKRSYKRNGTFGNIKPKGDGGVWELALRYSFLNLNDMDVAGGEESNMTLGINYYINPELRLMANYIDVDATKDGTNEHPKVLAFRLMANF